MQYSYLVKVSMKFHNFFESLILALKVFSLLTFTTIFLYWSTTAIIKFKSWPTSSSVAYRFGDDGKGNIDFPAITICFDSFNWMASKSSATGMKYKCSRNRKYYINNFYESLEDCTATTTEGELRNKLQIKLECNLQDVYQLYILVFEIEHYFS